MLKKLLYILWQEKFISPFRIIRKSYARYNKGGIKTLRKGIDRDYIEWLSKKGIDYLYWISRNEKEIRNHEAEEMRYAPLISIIVSTLNTPEECLVAMFDSVLKQIYPHWELCVSDNGSTEQGTIDCLKRYQKKYTNIHIRYKEEREDISEALNEALAIASGEFVVYLEHGDVLAPNAVYEIVKKLNSNRALELIYSDEDKVDKQGRRFAPYFKSDLNPDMLLSYNYLAHSVFIKKKITEEIGGFRKGFAGNQDYDLYLRVFEKAVSFAHIPKVLYHSTSRREMVSGENNETQKKVLKEAVARRGLDASVEEGKMPGTVRIKYTLQEEPLVSIIIPFKDKPELLDQCLKSIIEKSTYTNFEVIGVSNNSTQTETKHIMEEWHSRDKRICFYEYNVPYNYSKINNFAVEHYAKGEYLILLNNDMEIITPDWIESLLEFSQQEDIGAVGAKLYYPDNTIQHAGVIIGVSGLANHSHRHFHREDKGYFARPHIIQNLSAVTGACMMVKKSLYKKIGGLNERELPVAFNDVDFCLRLREQGYNNLFTPFCEVYHYESASRGKDDTPSKKERARREVAYMRRRHKEILLHGDPYYNANLTKEYEDFGINMSL